MGLATPIGLATLRPCRDGLPSQVFPDSDTLICDPNSAIASPHLMVAVAAQNYGQNSYRIRQPFDFAGRTGTIVFDVDPTTEGLLMGWISLELVEDPINAPNYVFGSGNNESGAIPKNGIELQFIANCNSSSKIGLAFVMVYNNYEPTKLDPSQSICVSSERDHLNHFEVRLSQQYLEIWATPSSSDGLSFASPILIYATAINLPFTRGYVSITTHNHATLKYSTDHSVDSWVTRWDNVGFDGPVITNWREYEVGDSLTLADYSADAARPSMNLGYLVGDVSVGPKQILKLNNVDVANAISARLSISSWYLIGSAFGVDINAINLRYRINGGQWHDRKFTSGELFALNNLGNGQISQMLDVPLSELKQGENTLELVTENANLGYPSTVQNIDLILLTE
jgi:hypothetical protein